MARSVIEGWFPVIRRYLLLNRRDNGMRIFNDRCYVGAAADVFFFCLFSVIREFTIKIFPSIYLSKIRTRRARKSRKTLKQKNTTRSRPAIKKNVNMPTLLHYYSAHVKNWWHGIESHGFFGSFHLTISIFGVSLMTVFELNVDYAEHIVNIHCKLLSIWPGTEKSYGIFLFFRSVFFIFLSRCLPRLFWLPLNVFFLTRMS